MRWEMVEGDTAAIWRPFLEDEDGPAPLAPGDEVRLILTNTAAGVVAGNIDRLVPIIDFDKAQVEVEWESDEVDVPGVFRAAFVATFDPGGDEKQLTYPTKPEDCTVVVEAAP